MHAKMAE